MKISIAGAGYVGLTAGTGFANKGNEVTFIDVDGEKVNKINQGKLPLHDDTLEEPFRAAFEEDRIEASTDYRSLKGKEFVFISVPTPSSESGGADLKYVKQASEEIGENLHIMEDPVVVVKSTVLPETMEKVVIPILERESGMKAGEDFGVCMNPEFLREGCAYPDFTQPDRVVIGSIDEESGDRLEKMYKDFDAPVVRTELREAEMIKYASNSLLATKISFSNEIGEICKELGMDTYKVVDAVGMDHRINRDFLDSGVGFGGSCFRKDVKAVVEKGKGKGIEPKILNEVLKRNLYQRERMIQIAERIHGDLSGKNIGVLGLAFKPGTDDIRHSPAITVIDELINRDCEIHAHDPKATENMKRVHPSANYYKNPEDVVDKSDLILLITDWPIYKDLEEKINESGKPVIEGRRVYHENENVEGVCW